MKTKIGIIIYNLRKKALKLFERDDGKIEEKNRKLVRDLLGFGNYSDILSGRLPENFHRSNTARKKTKYDNIKTRLYLNINPDINISNKEKSNISISPQENLFSQISQNSISVRPRTKLKLKTKVIKLKSQLKDENGKSRTFVFPDLNQRTRKISSNNLEQSSQNLTFFTHQKASQTNSLGNSFFITPNHKFNSANYSSFAKSSQNLKFEFNNFLNRKDFYYQ